MRRALLALAILPLSAWAQLRVFQVSDGHETPVGAVVDVSSTKGDTLETHFLVRNQGAGPVDVATPAVNSPDKVFRLVSVSFPKDPYTLAAGAAVDFRVAFTPTDLLTYTASVTINNAITFIVRGTGVASAVLKRADTQETLTAGAVVDFGSVLRGDSRRLGFTLSNPQAANLTVSSIAVSPATFRLIGPSGPLQLGPGQSAAFEIAFEPQSGTLAQGTLTVDKRSFNLKGQGLDPPLPGASITLASTVGASAQQNSVSIPLSAASQVNGTGTLTMEFQSGVAGVADDPAIQFLSGPKRAATVTVSAGDSAAKFGAQPNLLFQTGSTAGTILFTLKLGNTTQQATLNITPAPVKLDRASGVRRIDALDVSILGFDNTYSASQLAFTFYNSAGQAMQPGAMRVDASASFRNYFAATTTGGTFALLASFPVIGDTKQISAVDVEITNTAGVVTVQHIAF